MVRVHVRLDACVSYVCCVYVRNRHVVVVLAHESAAAEVEEVAEGSYMHTQRKRTYTHYHAQKQEGWANAGHELERWEGYRPGNWQIHGSYMLTQIALAVPEFRESGSWLEAGLGRMRLATVVRSGEWKM